MRDAYGRLVATLARRTSDIAFAEDALSDAILEALRSWPAQGVPESPEAWLLAVARRRIVDAQRRHAVAEGALAGICPPEEIAPSLPADPAMRDDRLRLLLVCAHPAIDRGAQAPLMLQAVLGLDAARIASAFLVSPAAMAQRLVRAKAKIRDARIPFEAPEGAELAARTAVVLEAIYAAYGTGWEDPGGVMARGEDLAEEALWLARLMAELAPESAEAQGLLALLLHCEARRGARRDAEGRFVPLDRQDTARWHAGMIAEAEANLHAAAKLRAPGRFQTEAAIQSVHAARRVTGRTDWTALVALYGALLAQAPSAGAIAGRASALGHAGAPEEGLSLLERFPAREYQPWWAARAWLLESLARGEEAAECRRVAAGMAADEATRRYLLEGG